MRDWIQALPKAELHLHIEGSLEPELMFKLARQNSVSLPYKSVEDVRRAYQFNDLQSFLDIYYAGASVLVKEQDFFDLTWAYLQKAKADGVIHAELFFDPQTHTSRGIGFEIFMPGFLRAAEKAQQEFGISVLWIMCFLRHLGEEEAINTLHLARPWLQQIVGVGLDSSEVGHPPEKFTRVFSQAKDLGLRLVAHAGEEGPPEYIWTALDTLQVERIDHGVRAFEDPTLVNRLAKERVPLTICPLSNIKLRVFDELADHNLRDLLEKGLCVTINADDPSYFSGYIAQNYWESQEALGLTGEQVATIARNSIEASFVTAERKNQMLAQLNDYLLS